ncbi:MULTISPECIES: triacylglycerol lipase [unclassified Duganella]|uniref:esterase/lipase family protein n=1 Tax=unclassified Duganella TaxID=2636909 RepID=UPI0006F7536E|nr:MULTISPECIES: triacylglycerol lipase [unclassified Duganella]KQV59392.1 lipase [Duganella sp. Root336D2]KRC01487.1 lipase [Duganella sp. Root198D2]
MKKFVWQLLSVLFIAITSLPASATGYTQTRYPIVLVHGLFGFDSLGPLEYFYGVPGALRSGGARVYVTSVSAANSTEVRGEQLLFQVRQVLAATGAEKVNLIGHSHGGPTSRYVASVRPDLVASVTSIGGVNKGSRVADVLVGAAPDLVYSVGNALGGFLGLISGSSSLPQDAYAAAQSLSTAGTAAFNARHPAGLPSTSCGEGAHQANGVYYFSWSGATPYTNFFDPADPFLAVTSIAFGGAKNDGLVASCSSHLGRVIRDDYWMNHLDEVNQMVGITHLFETSPVTLFRQHANRLQGMGL